MAKHANNPTQETPAQTVAVDVEARNWTILRRMLRLGELTGAAYGALAEALTEGHEAYPYYSLDKRPYVWADDRRWTAAEWNDEIARRKAQRIADDEALIFGATTDTE